MAPPPAALPLRWQAPPPPAGSPRPPHTSRPSIQRPCSGPRLTMPHPPLPGIVPRPLHTAPSPALDAAGHQPSSPPPPPPPFPRRASGHPVVPVRWAYLLVSSPERAHTHTLSVTSPAMSCNVHAVWTSEQSHCRTSLNAAHSAYILVSPPERAPPPRVTCLAMSCNVHDVCSTCSHAAIPLSLPPTQSPVPPPGREGSLPLSAAHYATCNTLHAICENGPAPPPPA